MKSPITDNEMVLMKREEVMAFRNENFTILYHYFLCEESGEEFTTDTLDKLNLNQVYNQYNKTHDLPYIPNMI